MLVMCCVMPGFIFSDDEPTALIQLDGGPCAVIAPVQAYLLKNLLFNKNKKAHWNIVTGLNLFI